MVKKSSKSRIYNLLSNNEKLTSNDILTLLILKEKGKITNPKLLKELNNLGSCVTVPESAGHYRRKLERMGVIEGYPAKINWKKVGYNNEFVILLTANDKETIFEIQKKNMSDFKDYRNQTGANIIIVPFSKRDKVILKEVLYSDKMIIIYGIATDEWAAMMFGGFYLPKKYPGINTNLLVLYNSVITNFELQEESIKSIIPLFYDKDVNIKEQIEMFKKEFDV